MFGTIVNFLAIILGSVLGLFLKDGIKEKMSETIMQGLALCIVLIGISGAVKATDFLIVIISIVIGAIIGEILDIDNGIKNLGDKIEKRFKGKGGKVSEGFVTSSLLFCVGAMAIVGSIDGSLNHNYKILYAKSMLDGISSIIFSSTLGIGVLLSSFTVLIYQGFITVSAGLLKNVLTTDMITNMSAVGSLLILGLGLNMLKITKIKVSNLLPSVFVPIFYITIAAFLS